MNILCNFSACWPDNLQIITSAFNPKDEYPVTFSLTRRLSVQSTRHFLGGLFIKHDLRFMVQAEDVMIVVMGLA